MEENVKKKVDESWKEQAIKDPLEGKKGVSEEKGEAKGEKAGELPPANFLGFITSLGMQAFVLLGMVQNPQTGKAEKDLPQAKYMIDTLGVLEQKTKGNLDESEQKALESLLYDLRMKYIEASK